MIEKIEYKGPGPEHVNIILCRICLCNKIEDLDVTLQQLGFRGLSQLDFN
jgi:hypothetical protein